MRHITQVCFRAPIILTPPSQALAKITKLVSLEVMATTRATITLVATEVPVDRILSQLMETTVVIMEVLEYKKECKVECKE